MLQYTMEVGYTDKDGNEYVDDYVLTDKNFNYVAVQYVATSFESLRKSFFDEGARDMVDVFKRFKAERLLDNDPDEYIQADMTLVQESTAFPDAPRITDVEQLFDMLPMVKEIIPPVTSLQEMPFVEEKLDYYDIISHRDCNGNVDVLLEVDPMFKTQLEIAAERELQGYPDAGEELYEQLAEMVIGNAWCYFGMSWEETDIPSRGSGTVLHVTVAPDISD